DVGLSTNGKITIYNHEGTAHAAVDIFGYYTDHHHDDRYHTRDQTYTKTEVDSALTTAGSGRVAGAFESCGTLEAGSHTILATTTIDTSTSGYIAVQVSLRAWASGLEVFPRCSITDGSILDIDNMSSSRIPESKRTTVASTRL